MIPVRLSLRNFMSYGEERTVIEFAGMHLACLSGDNGNGKSALLDAMTYALWGKTRASLSQASGEDDIVRLGAEEMDVEFDFRLGDDLYRVIRKRNRRTRSGDWQLLASDKEWTWRPFGATGARETEKQLEKLLRMEYETFLNSAYFQQGRADEFTRQKPDARKRILGDILDLGRYDRLEELARNHKSDCDLQLKDIEGEIRVHEAQVDKESSYTDQLAQHERELTAKSSERDALEQQLANLRTQLATLEDRARRFKEQQDRLTELEREITEADQRATGIRNRIIQVDALLQAREQITGQHSLLTESRQRLDALEATMEKLRSAERAQTEAERRLEAEWHDLKLKLDRAESDWRAVEERERNIAELDRRLAEIGPQLGALEQTEKQHVELEAAHQVAHKRETSILGQFRQIEQEANDVEEVIKLLARPKPICPVCTTDLSGGKREWVLKKQQDKLEKLQQQLTDKKKEGVAQRKERDELKQQLDVLEERIRETAALKGQVGEWTELRQRLADQNANRVSLKEQLESLRGTIAGESFGTQIRAEIKQFQETVAVLKIELTDYDSIRKTIREFTEQGVESRFAQLQEAERNRSELASDIEHLEAWLARRREQAATEREQLATLQLDSAGMEETRKTTVVAEAQHREATAECDSLRAQAERCRQMIEECVKAKELLAARRKDRERILTDRQAYLDLAGAFGKKGIQALIIENATPEIEEEANRLLARMTDNAMRVSIQMQREARSKAGQQIETLDIQITDDAGTRPYEMFSGGEAFRVNFAIRIALSRLLARRAGARLQTLIIDEGFGTQDAKGRERLVEAIESIKAEFDLILVISHIEDLKDAFPTRIEVTKTHAGSQLAVLN